MIVDDEGVSTYHTLPLQRKGKAAQIHSLSKAVEENRSAPKKR